MNKKEIEELLDPELISEAKERIARGEKISLRSDVGFKLFLSRNTPTSQYCLKSFLSAILGKPVDEATVINSEILPEYIQNKQCRLDINCVYNGMNRANLEMQVVKETDSEEKRAMYYASKLMSGSLRRGDKYGSIPEIHQVFLCDFRIIDDENFYHVFSFRDGNNNVLSESMQIHFIELTKLAPLLDRTPDSLSNLEFWSIVFKYFDNPYFWKKIADNTRHVEETAMITENNAEISQDYIDFCLALSREKAVRDYDSCIAEAEERGRARGVAEQRAADRAEIARLLEEVNRLKAAVSESKN